MLPGALSFIFFLVELAMLVIMLINNCHHPFFWTICVIMVLLQVYQLIEFLICQRHKCKYHGQIGIYCDFIPSPNRVLFIRQNGGLET